MAVNYLSGVVARIFTNPGTIKMAVVEQFMIMEPHKSCSATYCFCVMITD
jgi:hypothetical protein